MYLVCGTSMRLYTPPMVWTGVCFDSHKVFKLWWIFSDGSICRVAVNIFRVRCIYCCIYQKHTQNVTVTTNMWCWAALNMPSASLISKWFRYSTNIRFTAVRRGNCSRELEVTTSSKFNMWLVMVVLPRHVCLTIQEVLKLANQRHDKTGCT